MGKNKAKPGFIHQHVGQLDGTLAEMQLTNDCTINLKIFKCACAFDLKLLQFLE